jgi:hypothetical protein
MTGRPTTPISDQTADGQSLAGVPCSASSECLEPCRIRDDGLPEFDGDRWESGMHLMSDLVMGRLPEPCWIRNGRSAMKINPDESLIMARGIMLGYDVTEYSQNSVEQKPK